MNILEVRTYGHLYTLASMMGREGSGQKHSHPKAEWKVWVCRSFVYDAKVICRGRKPRQQGRWPHSANNSWYFSSIYYVQSDFTGLIQSILNNKSMRYYYQPHFIDKKTKDQRGLSQDHMVSRRWSWSLNLDSLAPEPTCWVPAFSEDGLPCGV